MYNVIAKMSYFQHKGYRYFTLHLDDSGRPNITAEKHILCYLWFVGHKSASYRDVADRFGVTLNSLYNIITRVTQFIMLLAPNVIKYPTLAEKEETATFYRETKGFPRIIGNIMFIFVCVRRASLK